MKEVQEQLEDPDYIWVDPDNPIPHPELGPLERRVSLHYEEALFMDEVDPEAMQYWFTCPPGQAGSYSVVGVPAGRPAALGACAGPVWPLVSPGTGGRQAPPHCRS